jgi:hypothetical protein
MPRLPDVTVLGARSAPQSRRALVQGGDDGAVGRAAQGLGNELLQMSEGRQKEDDAQAVFAARRQLDDWERENIFDPQKGAVNKLGKDAFDLPTTIPQSFDEFAGKVGGTLTSPRAKQAFQQVIESRRSQLGDWANRHALKERDSYDRGQFEADVSSMQNRAALFADDPAKVQTELAMMRQRTIGYLRGKGRSEEEIQAQIGANVAGAHVAVISTMVEKDQTDAAKEYLAKHGAELNPAQRVTLTKLVEVGDKEAKTQEAADSIMGQFASEAEAFAHIEKTYKGPAEKELKAEVAARFNIRQAADKEKQAEAFGQARLLVAERRPVPAAMLLAMGDANAATLKEHIIANRRGDAAEARARASEAEGKAVKTDVPTYIKLREMARTDPAAFKQHNLTQYADKIGKPEMEALMDIQDKSDKPDLLAPIVSIDNQINTVAAGIKDKEDRAEFEARALAAIAARQAAKGNKKGEELTFDERQKEIDRLLLDVEVPGFIFDSDKPLFKLSPEERAKAQPTDTDRKAIIDKFKARGINPTPEQVQRAFRQWKGL